MDSRNTLRQTGLSEDELKDLLTKLDAFVNSLSEKQQAALRGTRKHGKEASDLLRGPVKAGDLEEFIETRTESGMLLTLKKTGGTL